MIAASRRASSEKKQQYWQIHNTSYQESGQSQANYCERNKINLKTFAYWRRKLKESATPVKLVQLPTLQPQPTVALRLVVNGYGIEVCDGFSSTALAKLVRVLREL